MKRATYLLLVIAFVVVLFVVAIDIISQDYFNWVVQKEHEQQSMSENWQCLEWKNETEEKLIWQGETSGIPRELHLNTETRFEYWNFDVGALHNNSQH